MLRMFIYCDAPEHRRRVAVTNFRRIDQHERWTEVYPPGRRRESAVSLAGDRAPSPDELDDWSLETRTRFNLACPRCARSVPARSENLFDALDKHAGANNHEVALAVLAATLEAQSERS